MKYLKQESLYVPGISRGSCYPTVIACLLELELNEVPNFHLLYFSEDEKINLSRFYENDKAQLDAADYLWYDVLTTFLAAKGYKIVQIKKEDAPIDMRYMVTGKSKRGINHIVIYHNGKMIHDPHPDDNGIIEADDNIYEILELI